MNHDEIRCRGVLSIWMDLVDSTPAYAGLGRWAREHGLSQRSGKKSARRPAYNHPRLLPRPIMT